MVKNISGIWCGEMSFDEDHYEQEFERMLNLEYERKFFIRKSKDIFKIRRFISKGNDSLMIAKLIKDSDRSSKESWTITVCYYSMLYLAKAAILERGYETDDHYATQIALGHLLVPGKIEAEDLRTLEQTHRIFEEDYVEYFDDARRESSLSRYSPTKVYSERRANEVFGNATGFIAKLSTIIDS